jgi:hypothetical protein
MKHDFSTGNDYSIKLTCNRCGATNDSDDCWTRMRMLSEMNIKIRYTYELTSHEKDIIDALRKVNNETDK